MNKREAKKMAHRIAYRFVSQALTTGGHEVVDAGGSEADQKKVDDALDEIAQRHYELGAEDKK